MTEENKNSLSDMFTDSEFDQEVLKAKTEKIGYKFVPVSMKLKTQLDNAGKDNDLQKVHLETRTLNVTMPAAAWEGVDLIAEIFETAQDHTDLEKADENDMHARLLRSIKKNMEATGNDLEEVLVSQAALDNIVSFMNSMAQAALLNRIQKDLTDPDKLQQVLREVDDELRDMEQSLNEDENDD